MTAEEEQRLRRIETLARAVTRRGRRKGFGDGIVVDEALWEQLREECYGKPTEHRPPGVAVWE